MTKDKLLTVKELAALAGVTPQSVYKRIDNTLSTYVKLVDGQKMIDPKALEEIYNIGVDKVAKTTVDNDVEYLKATIELLKSQVSAKDSQLTEKDKQLAAKDNQINRLQDTVESLTSSLNDTTKALSAAQSLHAGTMQQQIVDSMQEYQEQEQERQEAAMPPDQGDNSKTTVDNPTKATFKRRLSYLIHGK